MDNENAPKPIGQLPHDYFEDTASPQLVRPDRQHGSVPTTEEGFRRANAEEIHNIALELAADQLKRLAQKSAASGLTDEERASASRLINQIQRLGFDPD